MGADEWESPLSSASTVFHTATNGGSGSAVNDGYPLRPAHGTAKRTKTNCPHSYPQPVEGTVAAALLSTGEDAAGLGSSQLLHTLWARDLSGFLASLSG